MIDAELKSRLEPIGSDYRRFRLYRHLTLAWVLTAFAGVIVFAICSKAGISLGPVPVLIAAAIAGLIIWLRSRREEIDYLGIAREIEAENPQLHTALLAAVEQVPDPATRQFHFLQKRVIQEALNQYASSPWGQRIKKALFYAHCLHLGGLALLLLVLAGFPTSKKVVAKAVPAIPNSVMVSPGDVALERGTPLVITARFTGQLPPEATLVIHPQTGENETLPLSKNLDDPVFGASISEVKGDLVYSVEYRGQHTREYKVSVFDFPKLQQADALLKYPDYTHQPEKKIENTRRFSTVEGTQLEYTFVLNKPVKEAKLISKDKSVISLTPDTSRTNAYVARMTLDASKQFELQLKDDAGRTNKQRMDVVINVLKNRTPEMKLISPRGDQRVSALEEVSFQGEAWDDFGLKSYGIAYNQAGGDTKFVTLGSESKANEKRQFKYVLPLEVLAAQPDQVISYFLWADDVGPDGQVRRSYGDMFFAEVRPFEEIYRQSKNGSDSEQSNQSEQSSSMGNQAEKLGELQKQIIAATWKLQRQETGAKPSANYQKDVQVVYESQQQALEQAKGLEEKADDPRTKALVRSVEEAMTKAAKELGDAAQNNTAKALPAAVLAEQRAYNALLKISAREFEVTRQRSRQSRNGQQQQANRRQLDQLEMKENDDKYAKEKQAAPQKNEQQREQLQVLNRLRELAQRQQDINEKLKELQTALQEAKTEAERDNVRRQLKRLQEEEQQMLADIDELRQRMEQPQNQSQMADAKDQLEKTRSQVQKAESDLQKSSVSPALAAGSKAQKELQDLKEDFRKKTSNQFTDEMRQMRSQARELAQKQEELGQKMEQVAQPKQKSLTQPSGAKELAQQMAQQQAGLTNLLSNMKRVTEMAENTEPLLAKQLYDAIRKEDQAKTEKMLEVGSELLQRGFLPQAKEAQARANDGVGQLKQSVERAAESVLGDETESLRYAKRELDQLSQELEREIAQADPANAENSERQNGAKKSQPGNPQAGNAATSNNQLGTNQVASAQGTPSQNGNRQGQNPQNGQRGENQRNQQANAGQRQGQQPGQQPGQQNGQGGQRGETQSNQQANAGQQPGQQAGQQPGRQNGQNGQRGESQGGQQQANAGQQPGQQQGQGGQGGQGREARSNGGQQRGDGRAQTAQAGNRQQTLTGPRGAASDRGGGGANGGNGGWGDYLDGGRVDRFAGPLTGNGYTDWSDRLRDVEETLDSPELRAQVAQLRDRARAFRSEFKRDNRPPEWNLVREKLARPLAEVKGQVQEELIRHQSNEALVPIDRDPVPTRFSELVRRYYEKLGGGE